MQISVFPSIRFFVRVKNRFECCQHSRVILIDHRWIPVGVFAGTRAVDGVSERHEYSLARGRTEWDKKTSKSKSETDVEIDGEAAN